MNEISRPHVTSPQMDDQATPPRRYWYRDRLSRLSPRVRAFLLAVILPTLVSSIYFFGFAADQYRSQASFIIQSSNASKSPSSVGIPFGIGSTLNAATNEAFSVIDYTTSHDAVAELQKKLDLVSMFRRPEADVLARLWWRNPTAEELIWYYGRMVDVTYDDGMGITTLTAHAFRPDDARRIVETLLQLAEQRVNEMNQRRIEDTLRVAKTEVAEAEQRVVKAHDELTAFSIRERSIDPEKSVATVLDVVGNLEDQLAQIRAQRSAAKSFLNASSPQYVAMTTRIDALQRQIEAEEARLTADDGSMAPILSQHVRLVTDRDFAHEYYNSALTSLEQARTELLKQQFFLSRSVQPNLPEEALFPRRFLIISSIFCGLLVAYAIGWLVVAGFREHSG